MTDKQLYIPATEEEALDKLKNENYLKNDYQRRRNAGQSLEEAWLAIWTMVELSGDELDQIIFCLAEDLRRDLTRGGWIRERNERIHEKLFSFRFWALPEAETYVLTKIVTQEK